ncbi:MAG: pantetheine-phosphate adenylyltransferase [Fibrobacter sp.]|nr:pantetheine-phosphate adenylyltransferase [Fibrobacter sp.]
MPANKIKSVKTDLYLQKTSGKKVAVFAGSFDPLTVGHIDIIERASELFDTLYVLIANNSQKKSFFPLKARLNFISNSVSIYPNVIVESYDGLTVDFMEKVGAHYLVRSVRSTSDLNAEQNFAWNNKKIVEECETVCFFSSQKYLSVSSTMVRELLRSGVAKKENAGDILEQFVPVENIAQLLEEYDKIQNNK